jgi:molybdate transport system substrate-binding protein
VGLISLTIASSPHFKEVGTFVRFPLNSYPPVRQCAVVMKASKHAAEAQAFLNWLTSAEVQGQLKGFGLDPAS